MLFGQTSPGQFTYIEDGPAVLAKNLIKIGSVIVVIRQTMSKISISLLQAVGGWLDQS